MTLPRTLALLCLMTACFETSKKDDSGGGTGGDGGDGGDGGGGGTVNVNCDSDPSTPAPDGSCLTGELSCGDTVRAQISGGDSNLDGSAYSSIWACWPVGESEYTGPERVFSFQHPGTEDAPAMVTISLSSPCANLDIFAMRWESDSCITSASSVYECEADVSTGGGSVEIWDNTGAQYVVVVEGPGNEDAPFALSVECDQ